MMNPMKLMKIKGAWDKFSGNHPKFPAFMQAVSSAGIQESDILEIRVTKPDGRVFTTNIRVTESDLELFNEPKELSK